MAEYIGREQLIGELKDVIADYKDEHTFSTDFAATIVTDILDNIVKCQPAADVAPVVRCRDCKHWLKDFAGCSDIVWRCEWANYAVGANGYCLYGERKEC